MSKYPTEGCKINMWLFLKTIPKSSREYSESRQYSEYNCEPFSVSYFKVETLHWVYKVLKLKNNFSMIILPSDLLHWKNLVRIYVR
jgi:hypothetical protein